MLACLSIAAPAARANEPVAPVDPGTTPAPPGGTANPTPPDAPQQPPPPGDPAPPPPPGGGSPTDTPPTDANPNPGTQPAPEGEGAGGDSWTVGSDRPSDGAAQEGSTSQPTGSGAESNSGGSLSGEDSGTSGPSGHSKDGLEIAPGVDNFDSFTAVGSGGMTLMLDSSPTCGGIACGAAQAGLAVSAAASANQLQQHEALKRDQTRATGFVEAMPPSPPGGIPGRAFSMPGGGVGGGAAFMLISMVAILAAALSLGIWTTSFRLPTATWRLSAYVPPIESPG